MEDERGKVYRRRKLKTVYFTNGVVGRDAGRRDYSFHEFI